MTDHSPYLDLPKRSEDEVRSEQRRINRLTFANLFEQLTRPEPCAAQKENENSG